MSKASDKFISETETKLATARYTAREFLQIISHVTEKSFEKIVDVEKHQENIENDVPPMTSDDPLECFGIECDEDETDCTKSCAWIGKKIFVRSHVGIWGQHRGNCEFQTLRRNRERSWMIMENPRKSRTASEKFRQNRRNCKFRTSRSNPESSWMILKNPGKSGTVSWKSRQNWGNCKFRTSRSNPEWFWKILKKSWKSGTTSWKFPQNRGNYPWISW